MGSQTSKPTTAQPNVSSKPTSTLTTTPPENQNSIAATGQTDEKKQKPTFEIQKKAFVHTKSYNPANDFLKKSKKATQIQSIITVDKNHFATKDVNGIIRIYHLKEGEVAKSKNLPSSTFSLTKVADKQFVDIEGDNLRIYQWNNGLNYEIFPLEIKPTILTVQRDNIITLEDSNSNVIGFDTKQKRIIEPPQIAIDSSYNDAVKRLSSEQRPYFIRTIASEKKPLEKNYLAIGKRTKYKDHYDHYTLITLLTKDNKLKEEEFYGLENKNMYILKNLGELFFLVYHGKKGTKLVNSSYIQIFSINPEDKHIPIQLKTPLEYKDKTVTDITFLQNTLVIASSEGEIIFHDLSAEMEILKILGNPSQNLFRFNPKVIMHQSQEFQRLKTEIVSMISLDDSTIAIKTNDRRVLVLNHQTKNLVFEIINLPNTFNSARQELQKLRRSSGDIERMTAHMPLSYSPLTKINTSTFADFGNNTITLYHRNKNSLYCQQIIFTLPISSMIRKDDSQLLIKFDINTNPSAYPETRIYSLNISSKEIKKETGFLYSSWQIESLEGGYYLQKGSSANFNITNSQSMNTILLQMNLDLPFHTFVLNVGQKKIFVSLQEDYQSLLFQSFSTEENTKNSFGETISYFSLEKFLSEKRMIAAKQHNNKIFLICENNSRITPGSFLNVFELKTDENNTITFKEVYGSKISDTKITDFIVLDNKVIFSNVEGDIGFKPMEVYSNNLKLN